MEHEVEACERSEDTLSQGSPDDESGKFFFDDEPLEYVLYDKSSGGPTPANLYAAARDQVLSITKAWSEERIEDAVTAASALGQGETALSVVLYLQLAVVLARMIPSCPLPVMKWDLAPLRLLIGKMRGFAEGNKDVPLLKAADPWMYRWYEHQKQYGEAREVQATLIELHRKEGNRVGEAVTLNNLAFEFQLEERWAEAMPLLRQAAEMFKETGNSLQHANSRANYWMCRFALDDVTEMEDIQIEVKGLAETIGQYGGWIERKPLILLAHIEERRGNIDGAIHLVKRAIASARDSGTRYPEIDGEYLDHLLTQAGR